MTDLRDDVSAFLAGQERQQRAARQMAAMFLLCGIDVGTIPDAGTAERERLLSRLKRMFERERLKGVRGHWSYNLNRHIALGQALEALGARKTARKRKAVRARWKRLKKAAP